MKTRRRHDPYALNPEKILAREKKKHFQPLCEFCQKRIATVHITACNSNDGKVGKSDLCEACFQLVNQLPQRGSCQYCGDPGEFAGGYGLPLGENHPLFQCEACRAEWESFLGRPEHRLIRAEYFSFKKVLQSIGPSKSTAEWLSQPENVALKAISVRLDQQMREMGQALEKHLKEAAANRKQL